MKILAVILLSIGLLSAAMNGPGTPIAPKTFGSVTMSAEPCTTGAGSGAAADVRQCVRALALAGERPLAIIRRLRAETAELAERNWLCVCAITAELIKRGSLSGDELLGLFLEWHR